MVKNCLGKICRFDLGQEDALQKEMVTQSNVLGKSMEIPWTKDLGSV